MRQSFRLFPYFCKCLLVLVGVWGVVRGQTYFNNVYKIPGALKIIGGDAHETERWFVCSIFGEDYGGGVMTVKPNGEMLWIRKIELEGSQEQFRVLIAHHAEQIVTCGFKWATPGNDHYQSKGYSCALNQLGDTIWTNTYALGYNLWLLDGLPHPDGGLIFTGYIQHKSDDDKDIVILKADSIGNLEWYDSIPRPGNQIAYQIDVLPSGGYLVSGTTDYPGNKGIVIKTDEMGQMEKIRVLGENGSDDQFVKAQRCPNGTILAVGAAESDYSWLAIDYYIAKLDSNLGFLWDKKIPAEYINYFQGFHIEEDGSFVVVGEGGINQRVLYKFDSDGNVVWSRVIAPPIDYGQRSYGLTKCSDGGYLISGMAGWDTLMPWLTKTDSNGCLNPSCIGGVGVPDMAAPARIAFYPSPAHSEVRLAGDAVYPVSVALHSTEGRCVLEATLRSANDALDVTALPAGVYVALGTDALGRVVRAKVLVE